jgi:hypothetical protein
MIPFSVSNYRNSTPAEILNALLNPGTPPLPPWDCPCHSAPNWGPTCGRLGHCRRPTQSSLPSFPIPTQSAVLGTSPAAMLQSTPLVPLLQPISRVPMVRSAHIGGLTTTLQSTSVVSQPISDVPMVRSAQIGCLTPLASHHTSTVAMRGSAHIGCVTPLLSQQSPAAFNMFTSPAGNMSTDVTDHILSPLGVGENSTVFWLRNRSSSRLVCLSS